EFLAIEFRLKSLRIVASTGTNPTLSANTDPFVLNHLTGHVGSRRASRDHQELSGIRTTPNRLNSFPHLTSRQRDSSVALTNREGGVRKTTATVFKHAGSIRTLIWLAVRDDSATG